MAIDFNRQMVFDPKIDIVGKEVPLEALDRTSTELQSRYDKSYENETKTQALAKKLMQDVAPEDEEVAKQAFDLYQTRLKERADKGDYHSMRWQTLQDATDFTNIYSGLSTKAKQLQEYKDKIATYDKIADPERKAFEIEKWKKSQSKTKFDPENRTLSGLGVSAPSLVDDGNMAEFANKFGTGIIANLTGRSNKNDKWFSKGEKLPNGQTALMDAIYDVSTSTQISEVTPGRVKSVVQNFLKADPDMMAYQQAMAEFYLDKGKGQITPEQAMQQAKDYIENSATQAAISKFANKQDVTANATGINESATNAYNKDNSKPTTMGVPVNTVAEAYGLTNTGLRSTLIEGLSGEKGKFNDIFNYINSISNNSKNPEEKEKYNNFKSAMDKIKKLTPEEQNKLSGFFSVIAPIPTETRFNNLGDPKLINIAADLNQYIGDGISFDNDIEKKYKDYTKSNIGFQNINLLTPHYKDADDINRLQTWMEKALNSEDFKSFKGKIDPKVDYAFSKVTDKPAGNGTGILIELKNPKDNSTILVEPKDDRMFEALEANFPGISYYNSFKNTPDFTNNEVRSIKDIFEENPKSFKGIPEALEKSKIMYSDGMYYLLNEKGLPVIVNGQPKVSTHYLNLF